jgi:hypothetical protein
MRVLTAAVTGDSQLRLLFSDGFCGEIDLLPSFEPKDPLRDANFFAQVSTNGLTIEWPGGIDYCPDTLREWCEAGSAQPVTPLLSDL